MTDKYCNDWVLRLSLAKHGQRIKGESTMKSQTMTVESGQSFEGTKAEASRRITNDWTTQIIPYTCNPFPLAGEKLPMNKLNFMSQIVACLVTALLCICTTQVGAQNPKNDDEKTDKNVVDQDRMRLEIRRLKQLQTSKVNMLESKLRADAAQLNANMSGLGEMRANIRSSLRAHVYEDRTTLTTPSGYSIVSSQVMASLPTSASLYFAGLEAAQLKNMQGRLRLKKGAFENLNRQYIREAMELERLSLIEDLHKEGETITVDMLTKPKSFLTPEEQNALADRGDGGEGKIMFGTPTAGDYVTPKSKIIYLLREESEAENLMRKPANFGLQRLVNLSQQNLAAKFEPGQNAEVLTEGEHMLKLRINDDQSPYNNFVGWVSKTTVARYRNEASTKNDTKKTDTADITDLKNKPVTLPGQRPKPIDPPKPVEPTAITPKGIIKLAGLPAVGTTITALDSALVWKQSVDLKNYIENNEDLEIRDAAQKRKDVDKIDDSVVGRVVKMDSVGNEPLLLVNIESPGNSLHRTKWWIRSKDTTICKVNP